MPLQISAFDQSKIEDCAALISGPQGE